MKRLLALLIACAALTASAQIFPLGPAVSTAQVPYNNGTSWAGAGAFPDVFLTSSYTNATTSYTSILALTSVPASVTVKGSCDVIWEGSATALTPTFAVELSNAPTDLYVLGTYSNGAFVAPTYTTITGTTQTAVTPALTTTTATTAYYIHFAFTLVNSTSANVLTLYAKSNSTSDTLTVEPGSSCGWAP